MSIFKKERFDDYLKNTILTVEAPLMWRSLLLVYFLWRLRTAQVPAETIRPLMANVPGLPSLTEFRDAFVEINLVEISLVERLFVQQLIN